MGQGAIVRAFLVFFHEMAKVDFLNGLFRDGFLGPKYIVLVTQIFRLLIENFSNSACIYYYFVYTESF